ncbi:MAG: isoprenylcysteine carboxylmethyltransferase family protein [Steroidobacteraceae bacterium]
MRQLEHRVPPPVVALLTGGAMWLVSRLPSPLPLSLPAAARIAVAVVLASLGVAFAIAGVLAFRQARTTVNPTTPEAATALVRTGVYRLTRNPMYLGLLLCLTAWAVWLTSVLSFCVLPAFIAYMNRFQIGPEERALRPRFGRVYEDFAARVRRW